MMVIDEVWIQSLLKKGLNNDWTRVSTVYFRSAVLTEGGVWQNKGTSNFLKDCIIYAINT